MESSFEITEVPGVGWKGGLSIHEAGWLVIRTIVPHGRSGMLLSGLHSDLLINCSTPLDTEHPD